MPPTPVHRYAVVLAATLAGTLASGHAAAFIYPEHVAITDRALAYLVADDPRLRDALAALPAIVGEAYLCQGEAFVDGPRTPDCFKLADFPALAGLILPALGVQSMHAEWRQGNFDMLRTTLLTPGQIVLAKLVGALLVFLLIFIATLPVMGALFFFSGVDWRQFGMVAASLLAFGLLATSLGVSCGIKFPRRRVAVTAAYGVLIGEKALQHLAPHQPGRTGHQYITLYGFYHPALLHESRTELDHRQDGKGT